MLWCQISDPHLVPEGELAFGRVDTPRMLERTVRKILSLPRKPDALVATGDLANEGKPGAYGLLAELLRPLDMPVFLAVGNHDDRAALRQAFRSHRWLGEDGFVQYAVEDFGVRLVVLDTLAPGAPGGRLCAQRLAWLDRTLAASARPTIVAQHHPPFLSGLSFMDAMGLADASAQAEVIARHPQVERVISGHVHRSMQARFAGTVASSCPSCAHQLVLNLEPGAPAGFTFEPSAFQMHLWDGSTLVTHQALVEDFPAWGLRG